MSGIANNGTPTYTSYYNQYLADLQFYHASPSFRWGNLVAGPLQGNAVVWSVLPNPWSRVPTSAGDGAFTEFAGVGAGTNTATPQAQDTLVWSSPGSAAQQSFTNGAAFWTPTPSTIPVSDSKSSRDPAGIAIGPNWNVRRPSYTNTNGQLMYVVAGVGKQVYGLFANGDASDAHWEDLGHVGSGENVSAISSFDGSVVFVGTDQGNICELTQPYPQGQQCVNFTIDKPQSGTTAPVSGLFEIFPTIAIATTGSSPGYVLTFTGQSWQMAGGGLPSNLPFVSVDGPGLNSVFAANRNQVFVSHDLGTSWLLASDGLPAVTNVQELHYVLQPDNKQYMYFGSSGCSMLRTPLQ